MPRTANTARKVIRVLGDGAFHSGEQLAQHLQISRSAVWKHLHRFRADGLEVFSVPGRGYRLAAPLDLLEAAAINAQLSPASRRQLAALSVLDEVDSTNSWLMAEARALPAVCLAERQTAGRGRRGRQWVSPFAANLYMSLSWRFDDLPPGFPALAMAAAVAAARALATLGVRGVGIKWPNDLLVAGRKLGGILVDLQGESAGQARAVVGIGINVRMPAAAAAHIDQPWTDLAALMAERTVSRNALAAALIEELLQVLRTFAAQGFAAFTAEWRALDLTAGKSVQLQQQHHSIRGIALGVDADGALLLDTAAGTQRFVSGDLSLRFAP
ncbi:MAG: bifunctional biotin--[acetyl-CoA-carboxylase] ligase/biotin operon repressor BirA [Gammaproteobacteria bacterium]|nr:bifunctional biotin--[acetyl-CoA-carboxylase] ligase/biotin operon repressor BirA [Gammaproteobacteria bacterium]MBU6509972.1 bifunctional biotin--[acetyl-CoA-carboxylase] ligase/biotin operon repressor BirA [Gammaproteobacteria bacterium]MDE2108698.1 bifunctional biotin--[acetyl-CoA-carboxylase] ligase/biotin operon repressor BirA [Gammaproteobacteria bacterium]MDE2460061.1 bifunctional biotin--[acetyl-CoA-carboxylase] ligase/biotin operon repressor BirA [Gammaproteobacteria bacterium]